MHFRRTTAIFASVLCVKQSIRAMSTFASPLTTPALLSAAQMDKLVGFVHKWNLPPGQVASRTAWKSRGKVLGFIAPKLLPHLKEYPDVFCFSEDGVMSFVPAIEEASCDEKTRVLHNVNSALRDKRAITGWRNEPFPVATSFGAEPELLIERAACAPYGVKAYGVHINGFIRSAESNDVTHIWVGKRSATKSTYPSMLDHIVAGGLPHGVGVVANVVKECEEEASIPETLARTARPVGVITNSYIDHEDNYKRDVSFCFDLQLPADFVPVPQDGEVESFRLQEVGWVLDKVLEGGPAGFKTNCNLVLIDLFIRHGIIHPESPRYLELIAGLRIAETCI